MERNVYTPEFKVGFVTAAWGLLRSCWTHRELIHALVKRDVLLRYRGSILGLLWSFISPLVLLAVYTVVFSHFFKVEWPPLGERKMAFVVMLFCGQIPYNFMAEVLSKAPGLIVSSPHYVKRISFPVELLPMVAIGSALFHALISTVLLLAAVIFFQGGLPLTVLLAPIVWLPFLISILAATLLLSAMGVFLRDLGHIIGLALAVLFFLTPIVYPESFVTPQWSFILWTNPLAYAVSNLRKACVYGLPINWDTWLVYVLVSLLALFAVSGWFPAIRRRFADVV